ncbi:GNAT family N-acetyltransferase [Aminipila terrae]|uniref:GNAT family N-acetyltransferase n=1 Tax=Aminipila terrae TaxID=2697030 RepID=A0A6P1MGP1_9FIRM|nr:GNAT family N-acetyltransferase [Aminipila terrae]
MFNNRRYISFYEEFIRENYNNVELSYIEINKEIAAVHFGFKDNYKIYYYIPVYDEKYINTGVGAILLYNIIEFYFDKVLEFDFLRGNEQYKFNWTDEIKMNYEVNIFKNNYLGKIKYLIIIIKHLLKKSRKLRRILNKI